MKKKDHRNRRHNRRLCGAVCPRVAFKRGGRECARGEYRQRNDRRKSRRDDTA